MIESALANHAEATPQRDRAATPAARADGRSPVVAVCVSFALGVVLAANLAIPYLIWWLGMTLTLVAWVWLLRRRERRAVWALCAACLLAGGLRYRATQSTGPNDVSRFLREEPQPVVLTGQVLTQPVIIPRREDSFPSTLQEYDRTLCVLACRSYRSGRETTPLSGKIRLEVNGHLLGISAGDTVEVAGQFNKPVGRRNPGGFDYREYLNRKGLTGALRTDYPDAVKLLKPGRGVWRIPQQADAVRNDCLQTLRDNLSPENVPIAAALLLGDRRELDDDMLTTFAESGAMHFLALSGLHVGILAGLLWGVCRLFRFPDSVTTFAVLICLIGYTLINDARPPVLRATIMAAVLLLGQPWYRRARISNSLAAAALILLLWNPAQLFEIGPQLSFLAVVGIMTYLRLKSNATEQADTDSPLTPKDLPDERYQRLRAWLGPPVHFLKESLLVTAAIWLFTLPLIMARFHLISGTGLLINVILMPVVAFVLCCGYLLLFCGLLLPPAVVPIAYCFDLGLGSLLTIVEFAHAFRVSHMYVPGPANWWLIGFYALLLVGVFGQQRGRYRRWAWRLLLCWLALAPLPGLVSTRSELRCTFLSVGHGCAVLVELPGGRTLLYDAGQLHDAERTERTLQQAAWARGLTRFDAVVISHADVDHFNALPSVINKFPVGGVYISPSLLDLRQPSVTALCDTLSAADVPIHTIGTGDRLVMDEHARIEVLSPSGSIRRANDNANSLVIAIEYGGRTILLTGDLEEEGLWELLETPPRDVDLLMAPHHGSLAANPEDLARWSRPEVVVVSGGRRNSVKQLQPVYGDATEIFSTWTSGAVTVSITADGEMNVEPFVQQPTPAGR